MLDAPLGLKSFQQQLLVHFLASLSTCSSASAGSKTSQNVSGMLYGDDKAPHTLNWNLTIDQRVPWHSMLELSYQGSRSRDLLLSPNGGGGIAINNINFVPVGAFFKPTRQMVTYYCPGGTKGTSCDPGAPPSGDVPLYKPWGYNSLYVLGTPVIPITTA